MKKKRRGRGKGEGKRQEASIEIIGAVLPIDCQRHIIINHRFEYALEAVAVASLSLSCCKRRKGDDCTSAAAAVSLFFFLTILKGKKKKEKLVCRRLKWR